tara:strand:+ start:6343 stop:6672 length:330 start_codon:yes stop_codon:yes gene_type:complete
MGFTDKMCHDVAKDIINEQFLVKYEPTIKDDKTWYENLNNFLVAEWDCLQESEDTQSQFTEDEENMITADSMNILLDFLNVDEDEFEDHEQDVDWMRFDDIIGHYICRV